MTVKKHLPPEETKDAIEYWRDLVKKIHKVATGYQNDIRIEDDLDFIIFNSLKIKDEKELAAYFLYQIATKHPFFDGNKRTALLTALVVLAQTICKEKKDIFMKVFREYLKQSRNDYYGKHQFDKRIVNFMKEVAEKKKTYADVLDFIEKQIIGESEM